MTKTVVVPITTWERANGRVVVTVPNVEGAIFDCTNDSDASVWGPRLREALKERAAQIRAEGEPPTRTRMTTALFAAGAGLDALVDMTDQEIERSYRKLVRLRPDLLEPQLPC
jgi:hypothetical protein